jgi:hypothetical protein
MHVLEIVQYSKPVAFLSFVEIGTCLVLTCSEQDIRKRWRY